jgi:preprotein translocase subunit SecF
MTELGLTRVRGSLGGTYISRVLATVIGGSFVLSSLYILEKPHSASAGLAGMFGELLGTAIIFLPSWVLLMYGLGRKFNGSKTNAQRQLEAQ